MSMQTSVLWIWLAEACGVGTATWGKLRSMGYSAFDVYRGDEAFFASLFPRQTAALQRLLNKSTEKAQKIAEQCEALGISVYHDGDENYPSAFHSLKNPPAVIYVKGNRLPKDWHCPIAVVGTRTPTDYGKAMAYRLAQACAKEGATVVSGLALGIDSVSHAGALSVGGTTVAVLASGLDIVSPARHVKLAREICQNGALVSEYPPGTSPRAYHFPCRNRLVASLSVATAVMEGALDSGAMITANLAMTLGKTVYALPGRVGDKQAEAPIRLLESGARMLMNEQTIVADCVSQMASLPKPAPLLPLSLDEAEQHYGLCAPLDSKSPKPSAKQESPLPHAEPAKPKNTDLSFLPECEKILYLQIPETGTCLPDELITGDANAVQVMRRLTHLEIEGLILRHPGGRISRA